MQNQVAKRTLLISESLPIRLFYFRKYFIFSKYIKSQCLAQWEV